MIHKSNMFEFLRSNIEKLKIHRASTTRGFSIFAHSARIGPILSCISPSQLSGVTLMYTGTPVANSYNSILHYFAKLALGMTVKLSVLP
jgi:hypothetical protein